MFFFSINTYINIIRSCLHSIIFDHIISSVFSDSILCPKPSLIQHIGITGMHNHGSNADISYDFGTV